jgi:hypothetical protein
MKNRFIYFYSGLVLLRSRGNISPLTINRKFSNSKIEFKDFNLENLPNISNFIINK